MEFLDQWLKENSGLYHANLLVGDSALIVPQLEEFFVDRLFFSIRGNPDYWKEEFTLFGVDEAHRILKAELDKAIAGTKKIFVLICNAFSVEAQNALLKMFEEPTANTHFFIIVPSQDILLPTVRSRLLVVLLGDEYKRKADSARAKKFVDTDISGRTKILESIVESKNKAEAIGFLDDIEVHIHKLFLKNPQDKTWSAILEDIIRFRGYLCDRSPSVKMLLEHLANSIPVSI